MSKTLHGALDTHLALDVTTLATCWKITRTDSMVEGYTEHDTELTVDAVVYAASAGIAPSAIRSTADLSVDNLDVAGFLDSTGLSEADLLAGVYDYATVEILLVNWADTTQYVTLRKGFIGQVEYKRDLFTAEIRGLAQALQQPVGEITSPLCRASLGDTRCGVRTSPPDWSAGALVTARAQYDAAIGSVVSPTTQTNPPRQFKCSTGGTTGGAEPSWNLTVGVTTPDNTAEWTAITALHVTATVTSVASRTEFTVNSGMDQDGWFTDGLISFASGNNSGYSKEIRTYTLITGGEEAVVLYEALPYDIQVGDTLTMTAGCDLLKATCSDKFDNIYNRRAEDFMPGQTQVGLFGGQ